MALHGDAKLDSAPGGDGVKVHPLGLPMLGVVDQAAEPGAQSSRRPTAFNCGLAIRLTYDLTARKFRNRGTLCHRSYLCVAPIGRGSRMASI
jgi:hypothetical protein